MRFARLSVMGVGLVLAAGCSSHLPPPAPAQETVTSDLAGYRLGSGDKLRITVFGETALTGEYAVASSGIVAFPLIGDVQADGLTPVELQDAIRAKLANGYIKDPRVSAEVIDFRPFYILGEVNKPGEYPYTSGLTVQQAVATAGGYTYRANTRALAIKRAKETTEHSFDLRSGKPIPVQPGDTIRVLERFF